MTFFGFWSGLWTMEFNWLIMYIFLWVSFGSISKCFGLPLKYKQVVTLLSCFVCFKIYLFLKM